MGSLFKTPKPAAPVAPAVMPTPDDEAVKRARKKSLAEQAARSGRQSTILDSYGGGDMLGGN